MCLFSSPDFVNFSTVSDKVDDDHLPFGLERIYDSIISNAQFEHTLPLTRQGFWRYRLKIFGQPT